MNIPENVMENIDQHAKEIGGDKQVLIDLYLEGVMEVDVHHGGLRLSKKGRRHAPVGRLSRSAA